MTACCVSLSPWCEPLHTEGSRKPMTGASQSLAGGADEHPLLPVPAGPPAGCVGPCCQPGVPSLPHTAAT